MADARRGIDRAHRKVIFASALGTVFEWYDFYLYGSLAAVIAAQFFTGVNTTTALIFSLLAFAAGFAVRPFGALVFGRLGDLAGRKYTFLITIVIMGIATALVGVLPTYETIGIAAPVVLILLRLLQGLAVGGEYGGAATYVAEHAPPDQRAYYTSYIQITAVAGLVLSLIVILGCRWVTGDAFADWGWRLPFVLSLILLAISVYIRLQLEESPVFHEMRQEKKLSSKPLTEAFGQTRNLKVVFQALFGALAGQAVTGYVALVYMLLFLTQTLKVDAVEANLLVAGALGLSAPLYMAFGKLSDRIGRKPLVVVGCVLAAVLYFPVFKALTHYANPAISQAQEANPVTVVADPAECSFQFDPVGTATFRSSCDVTKSVLADARVPYGNEASAPGSIARVRIGERSLTAFDGTGMARDAFAERSAAFRAELTAALEQAGYPTAAEASRTNYVAVFALLFLLGTLGIMTYAPIAAWLVELFPARIRYTSMSLPYHLGNGWFGGFLPSIAFAMIAYTGDIYSGLWYPVVVSVITAVVGTVALRETHGVETLAEDPPAKEPQAT